MTHPLEHNRFAAVVRAIDPAGELVRAWPLVGGISAQVTALEMRRGSGQTQKMVVRQHGEADRAGNPNIAADEFKLLEILQTAGVAAPKPIFVDMSNQIFDTPYIVGEFIDGQTEITDVNGAMRQMAEELARIHCVTAPDFLPQLSEKVAEVLRQRPKTLDDSLQEGRIRDVLEAVWPLPALNPVCLLHGDFWPGNVLWRENQLAAVIDWEDAAVGDPLADVANARLEILWSLGEDAMAQFTAHYRTQTSVDFTHLPYWDLRMALRPAGKLHTWSLDADTEQKMRDWHRVFVEAALALI